MKAIEIINNNCFADWSTNTITVDYDNVVVVIEELYSASKFSIHCMNFIGIAYIGQWDENIIEDIFIERKGDLLDCSIKKVVQFNGDSPSPGGGTKKLTNKWYQLNIKLIDGLIIQIVCDSFLFEKL